MQSTNCKVLLKKNLVDKLAHGTGSMPLWPTHSLSNRSMSKGAMVVAMEAEKGFNSMDVPSPRLIWLLHVLRTHPASSTSSAQPWPRVFTGSTTRPQTPCIVSEQRLIFIDQTLILDVCLSSPFEMLLPLPSFRVYYDSLITFLIMNSIFLSMWNSPTILHTPVFR